MAELVLYHNPRCAKSREALRLLTQAGHTPRVIHYLETPPNQTALKDLLKKLGRGPRDILRRGEPAYKELGLDDPALSDASLVRTMVKHPILIERPILISGRRAVVGRPPEAVLGLVK